MKCSRGKFARLSNIKIDTLRYYEECGLIDIPYNEESKSYEYTDREIVYLFMIKEMRSIGLSIEDVKYHFHNSRQGLEYQIEYLDQKIAHYQALKEQITLMNSVLKRRDYDIHEIQREKAYFFSFAKASEYGISKEDAANWLGAVPFAWANIRFTCDLEHYEEEYIPVELVLGIKEKYAKEYIQNLDASYVSSSNASDALIFNVETKDFDRIKTKQLEPILNYAKAHGYHFNGNFGGIFKCCEEKEDGSPMSLS